MIPVCNNQVAYVQVINSLSVKKTIENPIPNNSPTTGLPREIVIQARIRAIKYCIDINFALFQTKIVSV